ncbi:MAG: NAD-dependent epimerase/dehydratase family protein [Cyanobacteria bacterium P01_H01_bin.35]
MTMQSLITGGSGYFGYLLLRKLLDRGELCCVLDLVDADDRPSEVKFFQADIRDYEGVLNACKGVDIIYHNVAQVPLAKDKKLFDSVNILGTENLLKAALANGVKKVVYTSSSAVFGVPNENPVSEYTPPKPGEAYGRAKLEGENLCAKYVERGLDVSIIRPRTIIGHGRLGIFQILFEWIRQGYNVPVLGKGNNSYQFVHADDLAQACILAAIRPGAATYNCGTDRFGTMREVLQSLCDYAKTGAKVKSVPMAPAIGGMKITSALGISPLGAYHSLMYGRSMYFDISKSQSELGWQPQYSNEEMFIQSYDWYLKNRESVFTSNRASHHRSAVKQGVLRLVKWFL